MERSVAALAPARGRGTYKESHGMQLDFLLKCKQGLKNPRDVLLGTVSILRWAEPEDAGGEKGVDLV